jgi:hypothetical protein
MDDIRVLKTQFKKTYSIICLAIYLTAYTAVLEPLVEFACFFAPLHKSNGSVMQVLDLISEVDIIDDIYMV